MSSKKFIQFIKSLFEALDDDNSGFIEPNEITRHFLALGLAPEAIYIEKALVSICG
jgi:Ca2+-binding EF-hand superfamily protein